MKPIIQLVSISKRVPVFEVYKCMECGALMDRPGRAVCGDDYLDVVLEAFKASFINGVKL